MPGPVLSAAQRREAKKMSLDGFSLSAIARRFGVSRNAITMAVQNRAGRGRRKGLTHERVFKAFCAYGADETTAEVAKRLRITTADVQYIWDRRLNVAKDVWGERRSEIVEAWGRRASNG